MRLYVGNISPNSSEAQLRKEFTKFGVVGDISMNKSSLEGSYNFCFIEMPFENQASIAMRELQGKVVGGNALKITESVKT